MEKTKHVQCVPADMVDRLKKLLVRLWETRNPASNQLSDILNDFEPDARALSEAILDVSLKERAIAIKENEKGYALEKEKLRAELERISEDIRAAAAVRVEKLKVSFACEKAELEKEFNEKGRELKLEFDERAARQAEELAVKEQYHASVLGKVKELEKQISGLNDSHHAELMGKIREKEAEFRSRLEELSREKSAYVKSIEDLKSEFENEKMALLAEREAVKAKTGERYAELEEGLKASLKARASELEREYAAKREALAGELRAKEAELNREAAERMEFERATREAQSRRQETLLAKTAEDFKKAQKELETLAAENRRVSDSLAEKASELTERSRQFDERAAYQTQELAEKEQILMSAQGKVRELEKELAAVSDAHHSELMEKLREKEIGFRARLEEFDKEKAAYVKSIEDLKSDFESEKKGLEARLKAASSERASELEREYAAKREALAGELRSKEAELNREAAGRIEFERNTWEAQSKRQEALLAKTGEDFKKAQREIADLAAENRRVSESLVEKESGFERLLFEAKSEYEVALSRGIKEAVEAKTGRLLEALKTAEKKSEEAAAEAARIKEESLRLRAEMGERARQFEERLSLEGQEAVAKRAAEAERGYKEKKAELEISIAAEKAELKKEFEERSARQAEELAAKEQYLASAQGKIKELEKQLAGASDAHHAELMDKMREKEAEFRARLEEFDREKAAYAKSIEELKARFGNEKSGMETERERVKAESAESERRHESELALIAASTKSIVLERDLKLKSDLAKYTAELERDYAAKREALAAELRAKEAELNREAAGRIEFERTTWEAQRKRQETLLAATGEDFKKAQKEIEKLAAENRRISENLVGKEGEFERRLLAAKSEYEMALNRGMKEAVEAKTGRLLEALKTAEKKSEEAAAEAARIKEESLRLRAELGERARQFEERVVSEGEEAVAKRAAEAERAYKEKKSELELSIAAEKAELKKEFEERSARQAEELAAKEQYLASAQVKVKELEKQLAGASDAHHAELMGKMREKEAEFRVRLEEFGREKAAYAKSLEELKSGYESEKLGLEAERERIKAEFSKRYAEMEAGLKASLGGRTSELERDYAAKREALAAELRAKEAELNREAAGRIEFERATWEAQSRRQETLLAKTADDFKKAQKEIESLAAENRRAGDNLTRKEGELKRLREEAGKERNSQLKAEARFNEALSRERERLTSDFGRRRAALEAEVKERLAAFEEKEKSRAAEKARYHGELELATEEARTFVAERAEKMKSDFAKWKEALEKEYKEKITVTSDALIFERDRLADEVKSLKPEYAGLVKRAAELELELARTRQGDHEELLRLTEQLRAKDVLLISEKGRLDKEYLEKHSAMEARFESLKTEFELKDNKLRQSERKAITEKEALAADFSTRLQICENELAEWKSCAENYEKKWTESLKSVLESDTVLKAKSAVLAELRDKFEENESQLAAEHAAKINEISERADSKEAEMRARLEEKNKDLQEKRKTLESEFAARARQLAISEKALEHDFNSRKAGLIKTVDKIKADLERREAELKKREEGLEKE